MTKKNHQKSRENYQAKRQSKGWKRKKKNAVEQRNLRRLAQEFYDRKSFIKHFAPNDMSFINNTDEVLQYFKEAQEYFHDKEKVEFNIKDITNLSPDTITLMIANLNDPFFTKNGRYRGMAPDDEKLKKLFLESGFYNYVSTSNLNKKLSRNMLHKEADYKVRPGIAKDACIYGMKHALDSIKPFEPLYEILIECMQNTNNHASSNEKQRHKWWLFVYNDEESGVSKYSFLDLGVGIFESLALKNLLRRTAKDVGLLPNTHFVKDLLNGKIQSRVAKDNEIRGKGIPQIVDHSKYGEFKEFKIITNDVKIDLKTQTHKKLNNNFSGTLYYWELQKSKND